MNHAASGTTMLAPSRLLPAIISTYVSFAEENTKGLNASKMWVPIECCASQETVRFLGFRARHWTPFPPKGQFTQPSTLVAVAIITPQFTLGETKK
jgi:hypothetical protein